MNIKKGMKLYLYCPGSSAHNCIGVVTHKRGREARVDVMDRNRLKYSGWYIAQKPDGAWGADGDTGLAKPLTLKDAMESEK